MPAGHTPRHDPLLSAARRRPHHSAVRIGRHQRGAKRKTSAILAVLTVLLTMTAGLAFAAVPASAAPAYQITGTWAPGTPTTVKSGDVVTGVWRVNVNDDQPAPSNGPVDNVNFSVTLQNGTFNHIPDACLTSGVTPASSISADGKTLVCNVGTKNEGTAVLVQAPVEAAGLTGSQLTASGTIAGQHADLSPIDITNQFGMDIRWGTGSANGFTQGSGYFDVDYEWTLSKLVGSDPGPQTVSYNLNISSPQSSPVQVGPQQCTPYSIAKAADGHPWSAGSHPANQMDSFVSTCTITQTGPNTFQLTLSGINYTPANPPTKDSTGAALPTDQVALATGSIWIRVLTSAEGSAQLSSNAPTYTSTTGQTAQDVPSNNTESKAWTLPGLYSSGWGRGYTNSGGTTWDNTYQVAAGTAVGQYMDTGFNLHAERPGNLPVGMCSALDTKHATFATFTWGSPPGGVTGAMVEYYTGGDPSLDPASAGYNPDAFSCAGAGGWSTTPPADPTQVRAVRVTMTQAQVLAYSGTYVTPVVFQTIKPGTPAGTDVWSFMTVQDDSGNWYNRDNVCITPIPGGRYPCTTGFADVLHVVTAQPAITKAVDRSVVTPGTPAIYTLSYAANGAGAIPATVDGYQIVDTLPAHMTYVAGSATPAPAITTNGSGQQVLTWTLNGVPTNAIQTLTYQAVADASVTPGQALTNSATASYGGVTAGPATAQVTVSTSGYTTISKTADQQFIPNVDGNGNGTGSWTVTLRSFDPLPQPYTDTIDILPYRGDGRGTSYSGSYTLGTVTASAGATVYCTSAAPATLSDDPGDPSNGAPNNPTGNTVGWSTTCTPGATAVRVIGTTLAPGAEQQFTVPITTHGVKGGDKLVNRAQARDGHTDLVMRTSAPITVANYYSATLKKYVQAADGSWHDANDVADYPAFHYNNTIHYRIVVSNTGQGTLSDINVADDQNPALGAFHIDSLAPGKSQTHEYSIKLGTSTVGSVVNNACATAATPPDVQAPPTIPCDPAGFNVTNYTTVKTADPASGTPVSPGQVIHYTITVTQQGSAPAQAQFSDDLTKVLDDAAYNEDVKASLGVAKVSGKTLAWTGTVPVGGVARVTYSVIVHDVAGLTKAGDADLANPVTSPGCVSATSCRTDHKVGWYTYAKTATPPSGSTVSIGQKVTYTVTVVQRGKAAIPGATVNDDLTKVLDDASYGNDAKATSGSVSYAAPTLTWKGNLAVGQKVALSYSVTVTGNGDDKLANVVSTPDLRGSCDPLVGCQTHHEVSAAQAQSTDGGLASTGNDTQLQLILGGLLLGASGLLTLAGFGRRGTS